MTRASIDTHNLPPINKLAMNHTTIPSHEAKRDGKVDVRHSSLKHIVGLKGSYVDVQYVCVARNKTDGSISFSRYSTLDTLKTCYTNSSYDVYIEKTVSYVSSCGTIVWAESFIVDPVTYVTCKYSRFERSTFTIFDSKGNPVKSKRAVRAKKVLPNSNKKK